MSEPTPNPPCTAEEAVATPSCTPAPEVSSEPTQEVVTDTERERPTTASLPVLEDFQCPICLETFIDPVETECNHRFCDYCLQQWFRTRRNRHCPVCRTDITDVRVLLEVNDNVEAQLAQLLTPQQMTERNLTRRSRIITLQRTPAPLDFVDEIEFAAQMGEEFFSNSDDMAWQFELDLEDAVLSDGVFTRVPWYDRQHEVPARRRPRALSRRPFPSRMHPPTRSFGTRYTETPPQYTTPPFRAYGTPFTGMMSDVSDTDNERFTPEGYYIMPPGMDSSDEEIEVGSSQNQNQPNSATGSLEDLPSLRETIRQAEAAVASRSDEQVPQRENRPPRANRPRRMRRRNENPPTPEARYRTTEQDGLLAEFHQRFHQTELAFEAVAVAQNQLDLQGSSLREIYDRCAEAGLLDHGNTGSQGFNDGAQSAGSEPPRFSSYTAFLQHTFDRGIPPHMPTFDGISSPYYHAIWSNYLTNYQPGPHAQANDHNNSYSHPWYQRCLSTPGDPHSSQQSPSQNYHDHRCPHSHNSQPRSVRHGNIFLQAQAQENRARHSANRFENMLNEGLASASTLPRRLRQLQAFEYPNHSVEVSGYLNHPSDSDQFPDPFDVDEDLREAVRRSMAFDSEESENERSPSETFFEELRHFEMSRQASGSSTAGEEQSEHQRGGMNVDVEIGFELGVHYH